jgi:hypothetical protein
MVNAHCADAIEAGKVTRAGETRSIDAVDTIVVAANPASPPTQRLARERSACPTETLGLALPGDVS